MTSRGQPRYAETGELGPYKLDDRFFPYPYHSSLQFWQARRRRGFRRSPCIVAVPKHGIASHELFHEWEVAFREDTKDSLAMQHENVLSPVGFDVYEGIPVLELDGVTGTQIYHAIPMSALEAVQVTDQLASIPRDILARLVLTKDSILLTKPCRVRVIPPFPRTEDWKDDRQRCHDVLDSLGPAGDRGADIASTLHRLACVIEALVDMHGHHRQRLVHFGPRGTAAPRQLPHDPVRMGHVRDLLRECRVDEASSIQTIDQLRGRLQLLGSREAPVLDEVIDEVLSRGAYAIGGSLARRGR